MKKKILIIALVVIAGVAVATSVAPSSSKKDTDLKVFLKEAGFSSIPSLKSFSLDKEKQKWWNGYGVYFLSYAEMDSLCVVNQFIIGEASRYKEEIPEIAISEMKNNYDKIKKEMCTYGFRTDGQLIAPPNIYLSESEVGYWLRGEDYVRSWRFTFLSEKLENRLTKKGVRVMNEDYNVYTSDDWTMTRENSFSTIYVVGDIRKFNTAGMTIRNNLLVPFNPNPDPIAVIKHRHGYVILAKWI